MEQQLEAKWAKKFSVTKRKQSKYVEAGYIKKNNVSEECEGIPNAFLCKILENKGKCLVKYKRQRYQKSFHLSADYSDV